MPGAGFSGRKSVTAFSNWYTISSITPSHIIDSSCINRLKNNLAVVTTVRAKTVVTEGLNNKANNDKTNMQMPTRVFTNDLKPCPNRAQTRFNLGLHWSPTFGAPAWSTNNGAHGRCSASGFNSCKAKYALAYFLKSLSDG